MINMSDYNLITFNYHKYMTAETNEEKLNILMDFISTTDENFADFFFGSDYDNIFYMNQYDINDYMDNNLDDFNNCWKILIRNFTDEYENDSEV